MGEDEAGDVKVCLSWRDLQECGRAVTAGTILFLKEDLVYTFCKGSSHAPPNHFEHGISLSSQICFLRAGGSTPGTTGQLLLLLVFMIPELTVSFVLIHGG